MTRKQFEALAEAIKRVHPGEYPDDDDPFVLTEYDAKRDQWLVTARSVADMLNDTNERFNRERFLSACGVE